MPSTSKSGTNVVGRRSHITCSRLPSAGCDGSTIVGGARPLLVRVELMWLADPTAHAPTCPLVMMAELILRVARSQQMLYRGKGIFIACGFSGRWLSENQSMSGGSHRKRWNSLMWVGEGITQITWFMIWREKSGLKIKYLKWYFHRCFITLLVKFCVWSPHVITDPLLSKY